MRRNEPLLRHQSTRPPPPPPPGAQTNPQELRIQDFALVTQQTVKFSPGLNAITGESGSGKSVLIEALGQLLGNMAPPECVRSPATTAVIEGVVVLSPSAARMVARMGAELGLPSRALPVAGEGGGAPVRMLLRREVRLLLRVVGIGVVALFSGVRGRLRVLAVCRCD